MSPDFILLVAGITLPAELYEHQAIWRCGDQDLHYLVSTAEVQNASFVLDSIVLQCV